MIASPCSKVCVLNPDLSLCRGCYRTLEEIARWTAMSERERAAVLELLPLRRAQAAPDT